MKRIFAVVSRWAVKEPNWRNANIAHAMEVVRDWAVSNGEQKANWIATVRNAIRKEWAYKPLAGGAPTLPVVKRAEIAPPLASPAQLAEMRSEIDKSLAATSWGQERLRRRAKGESEPDGEKS